MFVTANVMCMCGLLSGFVCTGLPFMSITTVINLQCGHDVHTCVQCIRKMPLVVIIVVVFLLLLLPSPSVSSMYVYAFYMKTSKNTKKKNKINKIENKKHNIFVCDGGAGGCAQTTLPNNNFKSKTVCTRYID